METDGAGHDAKKGLEYPRAAKWIWAPWYAKFWWSATPCWWLGMAGSAYFDIAQFYSTALAGVMNVFFFPPVVFMLLGIGFFRELFDHLINNGGLIWLSDPDFMDDSCGQDNPMDARSGPLWVGNNLDPHSPNYVGPR